MYTMLRFCICWLLLTLIYGCAGITKVQSETILKYATSTKNAAIAVVEVKRNLDAMIYQTALMNAAKTSELVKYKAALEEAHSQYQLNKAQTEKIKAAFDVLYAYTEALGALSSQTHFDQLKESSNELIIKLNDALSK